MHPFWSSLSRVEKIIKNPPPDVSIYIEHKGPIYIKVLDLQFSFYSIPRTKEINIYTNSERNIPQGWSGIRLQPVAPLVLRLARKILLAEK